MTQSDQGGRGDELALNGGQIYIVQLAPSADVDSTLEDLFHAHGAPVVHRYHAALHGGALLVPTTQARAALSADPRVIQLDQDQPLEAIGKPGGSTDAGTADAGSADAGSADAGSANTQKEPTGYKLIGANSNPNEGTGMSVAVLDTGIDLTHPDLKANIDAASGKDCVNEAGTKLLDNNGHGSHVSGTIAAVNNTLGSIGVGTGIKIVPVKVLNRQGSGSWSSVICGIDWVTANAAKLKVASMSLGGVGTECTGTGCTKSALQVAIENSIAAGVTYAVAAGNDGADASGSVPAAYQGVITVSAYRDGDGALTSDDGWPSFTNYGSGVDIAAPGVNIYSTWKGGGYNTISGTSMATPHVAAAAALFLSTHPGSTPQQVRDQLRANATATYPGSTDPKHGEPLLDVRALTLCVATCSSLAFNCGTLADDCGGVLSCGTCGSPSVCTANVCVCTPTVTCASAGATCGSVADGCGNTLTCGTCTGPSTCESNTCACTPTVTCASLGANCDSITDDCGNTQNCGTCAEAQTCGTTTANVCG